MAKDRPGQTARYLLHSEATGKEGRCARSDRRRKPDRRCRKLRCRFLWARRRNASRKAKAHRKFVTALWEVASLALSALRHKKGVYSYARRHPATPRKGV
ncbi:hypothetical protein MDA_GLEAN10009829 [Myotis davidii]|uniref:Uncharacterized protein n=1 Tax=Myotis davidii TaxID=225400 RepID=L5M9T9_MYODS|nr:hypothetical protein MDA_GLEAN10009829 [Myotis davidii]